MWHVRYTSVTPIFACCSGIFRRAVRSNGAIFRCFPRYGTCSRPEESWLHIHLDICATWVFIQIGCQQEVITTTPVNFTEGQKGHPIQNNHCIAGLLAFTCSLLLSRFQSYQAAIVAHVRDLRLYHNIRHFHVRRTFQ